MGLSAVTKLFPATYIQKREHVSVFRLYNETVGIGYRFFLINQFIEIFLKHLHTSKPVKHENETK